MAPVAETSVSATISSSVHEATADDYLTSSIHLQAGQTAKFPDGSKWDAKQLCAKAIEVNPKMSDAYVQLARWLGPSERICLKGESALLDVVLGHQWNARQLVMKAIELNPSDGQAFAELAGMVSKRETVRTLGKKWTPKDLWVKTIELCPLHQGAYGCLAEHLSKDQIIKIKGMAWGAVQLYIRAIELDPTCADLHVKLSVLLGPQDCIRFSGGLMMDRCQLLLRAIQLDSRCALAYLNLGMFLPIGGVAQLPHGGIKRKEDFLAKARELDATAVPPSKDKEEKNEAKSKPVLAKAVELISPLSSPRK